MMYFFEHGAFEAMSEDALEELAKGRRHTASELARMNKRVGIKLSRKQIEDAKNYEQHAERLCERAEDFGLLHTFNDTWLEVRTWNNDIRGVLTLLGLAMYGMMVWFAGGMLVDLIHTYVTGHKMNGAALSSEQLLHATIAMTAIIITMLAGIVFMHKVFMRYEWPTQRWIRLRFNRRTRKVYLLRPKYAGGLMVFDWTDTQPSLSKALDPGDVLLTWPALAWGGKSLGQPTIFQFIARKTSFKTQGDWMAFWEYIRRYMEEGPEAVPKPKRLIGHAPSLREAWLSVTQWYPAFQQKGAIGNISDGITLLILPVIALIVAGNFIGQCLTWQARFPKEIENAGRG